MLIHRMRLFVVPLVALSIVSASSTARSAVRIKAGAYTLSVNGTYTEHLTNGTTETGTITGANIGPSKPIAIQIKSFSSGGQKILSGTGAGFLEDDLVVLTPTCQLTGDLKFTIQAISASREEANLAIQAASASADPAVDPDLMPLIAAGSVILRLVGFASALPKAIGATSAARTSSTSRSPNAASDNPLGIQTKTCVNVGSPPVDVPIAMAGTAATKALAVATAIPLVFPATGGPKVLVKTTGEVQYDLHFYLKKN